MAAPTPVSNVRPFAHLLDRFRAGDLSRRQFLHAAAMLGISAGAASVLARSGDVSAQASPVAGTPVSGTPVAVLTTGAAPRPSTGTESQTRGQGGQLRIIWWQAPSLLGPHANGDASASSLTLEPLMNYFPGDVLGPVLLQEVPSVENGLLAPDFSTVTLRLLPDLLWGDGTPVTANDIVFTHQWILTPANASTSFELWNTIASIEAVDDLTARVTYRTPLVNWFDPFVGFSYGIIYPAHLFNNDPANRNDAFNLAPIGTGPFKVDSFSPNDQVIFSANENYREPTKPYFSGVLFKGGGDAVSAGRAVVQTAEFDFAWNVQAEPAIINELRENGPNGQIIQTSGSTLEAIYFNFSDPRQEVNGQRSEKNTPHPILTDPAVRQAVNVAIQRELIAREFYGDGELATPNQLTGSDFFESPNTSWEYNLDRASQILDEGGWTRDGDVRTKDGVELSINYAASVNQVRQKTQAVVKGDLESIGIRVELLQVDATSFFDTSGGNDQNLNHFYWDIAMWSSEPSSAIPITWMANWYAGRDGANISQAANDWQEQNVQRYQNPEYDALYDQLLAAGSNEDAAATLIRMNDHLIANAVSVPIAIRSFYTAVANRLRLENLAFEDPFVPYFWNIANWNEAPAE